MRAHKAIVVLFAGLAMGASAACFRSTAPRGWLPRADSLATDAFGAWARVDTAAFGPSAPVEGELIALDDDSLHVLGMDGTLRSLSITQLRSITLTTFRQNLGELKTWAGLGFLSTVSHGFYLILTGPVWALAGTVATSYASTTPRLTGNDGTAELRKFARFPQGIPPTLDRGTLQPRP